MEKGKVWSEVAESLNSCQDLHFKVSQRSVRERFDILRSRFKRKNRADERSSGTSETPTELDEVIFEIIEKEGVAVETESGGNSKKKMEADRAAVEEVRKKAMERVGPTKKRLSEDGEECEYGRLVDLCSPVHKKYQLAVTKVFGHYMNAIVVASGKVARDCIGFLKQERAERETFLPIDYLQVSPLNERLRNVRGARMVMDVVQWNSEAAASQLRTVVQFVCGNALVCETIQEARRIAYDGPERLMTVALDGTMFAKSGVISGGSSDLRHKARRWDEKDMTQLKERKEKLTAEMRGLMKLKRKESELKQIQIQAQGAQTRLKYSTAELDNLRKKNIHNCQADISRMESELANVESRIQMQEESVTVQDAQMRSTRDQIDQMEDLVFAEFCAEIGILNIREYEEENLKHQTELDKKRLEFESQHTRLSAQLQYEQDQLDQQKKKLDKLEETIAKEEKAVADQRKEEKKLLEALEESQTKLLELKNHLLLTKSQVADAKAELDQKTQSLQETSRELVKLQRGVISVDTALEQKRLAKHNLLLACEIQGLSITLLSGSLPDISQLQLDVESQSTSATMDIYEREAQLVIDYSDLGRQLMNLQTEEEVEAQLERMRESVSSIDAVLQRTTAPNLKALQKMREVKDMYQDVVAGFEASTRAARKCNHEFEEVKAKRFRLFNRCFEHVVIVIDQIYKRLCRNTSAQAILSAENPDEPYLGGIIYTCVAPGKRFVAMDNLSGGEKAVAALALIFAIHSYRPAPFFVLDEVDAALDNTNISKVTSFIKEESSNMQIIVISLKEEFYSRADTLLGVFSGFEECMFSRMVTMDLRPYPLNQEDNGTQQETDAREEGTSVDS
ncbi:structural maintenance of chromosomes protein 1B-like [Diretmus argenteus]